MTRLIAIAVFMILAVLLIHYRSNKKVQHSVVIAAVLGLIVYTVSLVISELIR